MRNLHSTVHTDKSKVEISQNLLAFSEDMNFNTLSNTMYDIINYSLENKRPPTRFNRYYLYSKFVISAITENLAALLQNKKIEAVH